MMNTEMELRAEESLYIYIIDAVIFFLLFCEDRSRFKTRILCTAAPVISSMDIYMESGPRPWDGIIDFRAQVSSHNGYFGNSNGRRGWNASEIILD